jgi:predicted polyphosphate/ATP-dependent NAD kinase
LALPVVAAIMQVGVVVNPVAGMGGRVGLKGTDGKVEEARERGATRRAPDRAREALTTLAEHDDEVQVLAVPGAMGGGPAQDAGFEPTVVTDIDPDATTAPAATTAADTRRAVETFAEQAVDLVLFVGGDGTAVDVAEALDAAEVSTPMLGVPAGVKVYSSVFAVTPADAGRIAATFDRVAEREINDIDEDAYRGGKVETELRAVRPVPVADRVQSTKQLGGGNVESLAAGVTADVEPGVTYVLGPGSTVGAIADELGLDGTPLGVDVWKAGTHDPIADGEVLVRDGSADEIEAAVESPAVVIVSPIGGQGFVFGRGNQQISPEVVRRCDLEIVASRHKLDGFGSLRVDTDDDALDEELTGWHRVRVGRFERRLLELV